MLLNGVDQKTFINETPITANQTLNGTQRDCAHYESFGVSLFAQRGAADATLEIRVEHRTTPIGTWRLVENETKTVTAGDTDFTFDKVYAVVRPHMRIVLIESAGQALGATELVETLKPTS